MATKSQVFRDRLFAALLLSCATLQTASAELPILQNGSLLGWHSGSENRHYQIGLTPAGKIRLSPLVVGNAPISQNLAIMITIAIEESKSDGTVIARWLQIPALQSSQPATDKLENSIIHGKTTGDASFELFLEQFAGTISIDGRLLDDGTIKNPLRFTIRVAIPDYYPYEKKSGPTFLKKTEDDRIDIEWTDGKGRKLFFVEPVDATSPDINGPGIAAMEIDIGTYKDEEFLCTTTENARMSLSNSGTASLHKGFTIHWGPDPANDKDAKARLSVAVK